MSAQSTKYELLKEEKNLRQRHTYIQVCLLTALCAMPCIAVYATWTAIYKRNLNIPPILVDIPDWWPVRTQLLANHFQNSTALGQIHLNISSTFNTTTTSSQDNLGFKQYENERVYPSKLGSFFYTPKTPKSTKLVCYYSVPKSLNEMHELYPQNIDAQLCTHLNIGVVTVRNNSLVIDSTMASIFKQSHLLKRQNVDLKILIWIGGPMNSDFGPMVSNHTSRKTFIKSVKSALETYSLDGIDLDWEFPSAYNKERMHFSQLLHEIRREYEREHRTYLLSVAVAAPEGIVYFAYDVREINKYADYVNVMTYDYHFYSTGTPFTGLNAPLYSRHDEKSIFSTLNINYTVNYWHSQGLDKNKIIIGLPTYGHSFKLVNPFNTGLISPAEDYGYVGSMGFVSYSQLCWFKTFNFYVTSVFDVETCSPYLYSGTEWISYEDEQSLECKANFIKANGFGGAMIFSLNSDDYASHCKLISNKENSVSGTPDKTAQFPLSRKVSSILFNDSEKL